MWVKYSIVSRYVSKMVVDSTFSNLKSRYFATKLGMIAVVGLIFLLASFWLNTTIGERKSLLHKAKEDIVLAWAGPQTLIGPLLIVPYTDVQKKDVTRHMVFLPHQLDVKGVGSPEIRHRGIFDVLVYQADISLNCQFLPLKSYQNANQTIHWDQAKVVICLDDVRGLNNVVLKLNGHDVPVRAGSGEVNAKFPGVHVPVILNENEILNVALNINMKGSDTLSILPIAKENKIGLGANWPDPSFIGQFLPNTKNITKKDFQAQWQVSSLATSLPEHFDLTGLTSGQAIFSKTVGVRFLKTADHYLQAERTAKYSFLFVLYTFLVFFLYEVAKKTKIHIFQYCITACSLLCFSLLLTALAEHMSFELAYGLSSLAIIAQIAFYAFGLLHKNAERMTFVGLLVSLYLYLFIVLRLEEVAFLVGALGMFVLITIAMFVTKKINWFDEKE
jgi:inner membrane protein